VAERHDDRFTMLLEAGMAMASELSLPALLQRIIDLAAAVTGARYGALGVIGRAGSIREFVTTGIADPERARIGHLPVGRGILGLLIEEARPIRIPDIGQDPRSVGFPPDHPPMRSFLGVPVVAGGKVFGNLYLTEKQGASEFTEEDEQAVVLLAAQAGVAIDNARLYEEARLRERRLEATREITEAILTGAEPPEVLGLIARRARELMHADLATIAVPADDPGQLVLVAADGKGGEELLGMRFTVADSVSGSVISSGRPAVIEQMRDFEGSQQPMVRAGDIGPAMFVPLSAGGQPFGTLAVGSEDGREAFERDDLGMLETFAGQASVALEYARARRELDRLMVMEDRERIAKELHDGVIQSLFAVGMGMQATATMARDPEIEERVESAVAEIDRVIRDLRNYIFGLRPGILADQELDQALRQTVREFEERTGTLAIADIDPKVASALGPKAPDVLQLAREALSNVGRHADATTCRVSLVRDGGAALLEIDDDGQGFDPAERKGAGQGLRNLEERAADLGGSFEIQSVAKEGTTVRIRIPL
jgi:two-component system, NarL family, sensor histidine kinase DevS